MSHIKITNVVIRFFLNFRMYFLFIYLLKIIGILKIYANLLDWEFLEFSYFSKLDNFQIFEFENFWIFPNRNFF